MESVCMPTVEFSGSRYIDKYNMVLNSYGMKKINGLM